MLISKPRTAPAPVTFNAPSRPSPAHGSQARQPAQYGHSPQSSFVSAPKAPPVELTGGKRSSPIDFARELLNMTPQEIKELKQEGSTNPIVNAFISNADTQSMGHCASFVSSYLQAAGQQDFFPAGTITGAPYLYYQLVDEAQREGTPWTAHNPFPAEMLPGEDGKLTPEQAAWWEENMEVGAPVFFRTGDGNDRGHVVIYTGIVDGEPMFMGANSVDADGGIMDGPQQITEVSYSDLVGWMSSSDHTSTITSAFSYSEPAPAP
ncbi:MAG: hypothetical protein JXB05_26290 [Myxococcaceae bacterium]|nr:hypothetical protein [Myxococcaceae bacterium]